MVESLVNCPRSLSLIYEGRFLKQLATDTESEYKDAGGGLQTQLAKFNQSLLDAGFQINLGFDSQFGLDLTC